MIPPPLELLPQLAPLIGGRRVEGASGGVHEHVYAATGRRTVDVPLGGAAEMDEAVACARRALPGWRGMPAGQRRDLLIRLAQAITADAHRLSRLQTIESAVPIQIASALPGAAADYFLYNAGWADKIGGDVVATWPTPAFDHTLEEPYGVVALIIPWNSPLMALAQLVAPALAAGNTVVLKPPELAPFTSLRVGELMEEVGFPPGVMNVVPGGPAGGEALVRHPGVDKIHFTGSGATARRILAAAQENLTPVGLELGGKSALLIFEDADLMAAAKQALSGLAVFSGQGCTNGTRVFIAGAIFDRLCRVIEGMVRFIPVGDPLVEATLMGPLVSAGACERVLGVIERARAGGVGRLASGGQRLGGELAEGYFVAPTLFADVPPESDLAQEEIFGPVVCLMKFTDEAGAVAKANQTRYGLAAYAHTADLRRALRLGQSLEAGTVWLNGITGLPAAAPFGGVKQSGFGRVGGRAGIREFTRSKNVWMAR